MQNLFINDGDEITINFTVAESKDGTVYCGIDKDTFIESLPEECEIKDYKAVFKKPSFGDSLEIYNIIFGNSQDVNFVYNPVLGRYNKIIALIKKWDLTEGSEKPSEEQIKKLHPIIANTIGIQLELLAGDLL